SHFQPTTSPAASPSPDPWPPAVQADSSYRSRRGPFGAGSAILPGSFDRRLLATALGAPQSGPFSPELGMGPTRPIALHDAPTKLAVCPPPPERRAVRPTPRQAQPTACRRGRFHPRSSNAWIALLQWTPRLLWRGCAAKDRIPGPNNHARRRAAPVAGALRSHYGPGRYGSSDPHDCGTCKQAVAWPWRRADQRDRVAAPWACMGSTGRRSPALVVLPFRRCKRDDTGGQRAFADTVVAHQQGAI